MPNPNKKQEGLIGKFVVTRTDDSSGPTLRHDGCWYFVLDIKHDSIARFALMEYAERALHEGYNILARDLSKKLMEIPLEKKTDA